MKLLLHKSINQSISQSVRAVAKAEQWNEHPGDGMKSSEGRTAVGVRTDH
jgi:hypothetical protein